MVVLDGSPTFYFYLHLYVIHDLRVLIPFTLFEVEFLAIVNVAPSHIRYNVSSVIRAFKVIWRRLEVFHYIRWYFLYMVPKSSLRVVG